MKEIVIKMPDEVLSFVYQYGFIKEEDRKTVHLAILECVELPKGHTELIDTKELIQDFAKAEENMKDNGVTPVFDVHEITNMILSQDVIIEADKEEI